MRVLASAPASLGIGRAGTRDGSYREPLSQFAVRKYGFEFAILLMLVGVIALVEYAVVTGQVLGGVGSVLLLNGLLIVLFLLIFSMVWSRKDYRPYGASDTWVTLPFSKAFAPRRRTPFSNAAEALLKDRSLKWVGIPERMPMSALDRVAVMLSPAYRTYPYLVGIGLSLDLPSGRATEPNAILLIRGDNFGEDNVRDLLLRVPPDRIAPGLAEGWRNAAATSRSAMEWRRMIRAR